MHNMELFDLFTAAIRAELIEHFPLRCTIDAEAIARQAASPRALDVAVATIEWLEESGYLRFHQRDGLVWRSVGFTARAESWRAGGMPSASACLGEMTPGGADLCRNHTMRVKRKPLQ